MAKRELPWLCRHRARRWWLGALVFALGLVVATALLYTPRRMQRLSFLLHRVSDRGSLVFVGDSIFAGWTNLAETFPEWKVANRAIDGDGTGEILRRLDTDVLALEPSGIVLLAGTNDLNYGLDPKHAVSNLVAITRQIRSRFPGLRIVVCKLMPREWAPPRYPGKLIEVNTALEKAFEADPQITLFDTWSLFADSRGVARTEDFPDLLHPGPEGYRRLAAALRPFLKKTFPPAAPSSAK